MADESTFQPLKDYLSKIPAIEGAIGCGFSDDGLWWVKFTIDIEHPLAWSVVQELGHVLNYVSVEERLPTIFMPVSIYASGNYGGSPGQSGSSIAIVGRTDLFNGGEDIINFDQVFMPQFCCYSIQTVLNGPDPGDLGGAEEAEATLDVTWSGAIAPNTRIYNMDFVVSASTNTTDGVDLSELFIIDNNLASIMTESFGSCEGFASSAEAQGISTLAEQGRG